MEDDIRKEQNKIREDVIECKTDIADNKQGIHNINTRHIPPNIKGKLINCYIFFHIFFNGKASLKQECQCLSI